MNISSPDAVPRAPYQAKELHAPETTPRKVEKRATQFLRWLERSRISSSRIGGVAREVGARVRNVGEFAGNVLDIPHLRKAGRASRDIFIRQEDHFWLPNEDVGKMHARFKSVGERLQDLDRKLAKDLELAQEMGVKQIIVGADGTVSSAEHPVELPPDAQRQVDNLTVALAREAARIARERHPDHGPDVMAARGRELALTLRPQVRAQVLANGEVQMTAVLFDGTESQVRLNPQTGEVEFFNGNERDENLANSDRVAQAHVTTYVYSPADGGSLRYVHDRLNRTQETDRLHGANTEPPIRTDGVASAVLARQMQEQMKESTTLTGVLMSGGDLTKHTAAVYVEHGRGTLSRRTPNLVDQTRELTENEHDYRRLNGVVVVDRVSAPGENRPSSLNTLELGNVNVAGFGEREQRVMAGETDEQIASKPTQRVDLLLSAEAARQFKQLSRAEQLAFIRQYRPDLIGDANELTLPVNVYDETSGSSNIPPRASRLDDSAILDDLQGRQADQLARTRLILSGAMTAEDIQAIDDPSDMVLTIAKRREGYTNPLTAMQRANEVVLQMQTEVDRRFRAPGNEKTRQQIAREVLSSQLPVVGTESAEVTEMRERLIQEVGGRTSEERMDYVARAVRDPRRETVEQFNDRLLGELQGVRGWDQLTKEQRRARLLALRNGIEEVYTPAEIRRQIARAIDPEDGGEPTIEDDSEIIQDRLDAMRERAVKMPEGPERTKLLDDINEAQMYLDNLVPRVWTESMIDDAISIGDRDENITPEAREELEAAINRLDNEKARERLSARLERVSPKPRSVSRAPEDFDIATKDIDPSDREGLLKARERVIAAYPPDRQAEVEKLLRFAVPPAPQPSISVLTSSGTLVPLPSGAGSSNGNA